MKTNGIVQVICESNTEAGRFSRKNDAQQHESEGKIMQKLIKTTCKIAAEDIGRGGDYCDFLLKYME